MIEIGTKLFLKEMKIDDNDQDVLHLRCRVIDYEGETVILVDYPVNIQTDKQALILDGTEFIASFLGKDGAIYEFSTEVLGRKRDKVPMLRLVHPDVKEYRRIQRRDYVRVNTVIDVELQYINNQEKLFQIKTVDISGGGCQLLLNEPLTFSNEESEVKLTISLPMQKEKIIVETKAKFLRSKFEAENPEKIYASFEFIEIQEADRQKIIKYCFDRQLAQRNIVKRT